MKTNRDALWSLAFLLGLPVVIFGAMQVLALAMPDTPRAPYQTALVMALGLIWFAPFALWQARKPSIENGPRAICRNVQDASGLLMLQLVVVAHNANSVAKLLFFLGLFSLIIGVPLLLPSIKSFIRLRPLARRILARRALRSMGFATLMALPLWLIAQATAAQALWIWLICLGVVAGVLPPGTVPRAGATRLGRRVIGLGENLSLGAMVLVGLWISGYMRPEDPDQQIAFLVTSALGVAGGLGVAALILPWFFSPKPPRRSRPPVRTICQMDTAK